MQAAVPCLAGEKHGWLGDAQVTAEEAAYNLWAPTVHTLFLDLIRDQQQPGPSDGCNDTLVCAVASATAPSQSYAGFVPGVVPGSVQKPGDLSWTAAYPLIARWLLLYHGALHVVRDHWASLKAWADGVARVAAEGGGDALPDFWVWGDWCAVEARSTCTPGTGPQAAASNYILALKAMSHMAGALNEPGDAKRYADALSAAQAVYDLRFWNASAAGPGGGGWVGARPSIEHQTLAALAINAMADATVPQAAKRAAATVRLLQADVAARGYHLTVGSAGGKWLLRTLTAGGAHDAALQVATQTTSPSWGHWLDSGATTCWENWSGVADPSHPPEPTHNHIFLCGGLGEWMHRSLGGIAPAKDGYATASISPAISPTLGPSAVNASVMTVRGRFESSWVRGDITSNEPLLRLAVRVPAGATALVHVPLLGRGTRSASIRDELSGESLWPPKGEVAGVFSVEGGDDEVRLSVGAGVFRFVVCS